MSDPYLKDPGDKLDYGFEWEDWLLTDTITASTWSISPAGPTLSGQGSENGGRNTVCWVEGGTHGKDYRLTNAIETAGGRKKQETMVICVRDNMS